MTAARLAETDVLIWWGHAAHGEVSDAVVDMVCDAVWAGMGAIFLHSAHFSKPFKRLMGAPCNLTWREAGERERLWVTSRNHPIAAGLPDHFELENEEMYGEPFGVPEPLGDGLCQLVPGRRGVPVGPDLQARRGECVLLPPGARDLSDLSRCERAAGDRATRCAGPTTPQPRLADPSAAPNVPVAEALEPIVERGPRLHHDGEEGLPLMAAACSDPRHRRHGRQPCRGLCRRFPAWSSWRASIRAPSAAGRLLRPRTASRRRFRLARRGAGLGRVRRGDQRHPRCRALSRPPCRCWRRASMCCAKSRWPPTPPTRRRWPRRRRGGRGEHGQPELPQRARAAAGGARWCATGAIGTVRHFEASYLQSWLTQPAWGDWRTRPQWLWRLSTAHGSKGVLGDVGIHILDFATFIAGMDAGRGRPAG